MTKYGSAMTYGYRFDGLRAWNSTGGTTTYFIYDQFGNPVLETKSGSVSAINTFGTNGLISRDVISGADTFYQFDPQGNTVTRSNNSATIVDYHGSDPYGDQYASASSSDPYQGFGAQWGYYFDSVTGVSLLGHRYYDPAYARFLNQDPIGFGGGINVYSYAENNPIGGIDPSGARPLIGTDLQRLGHLFWYGMRAGIQPGMLNGAVAELKRSISAIPSGALDPASLRAIWYEIDNLGNAAFSILMPLDVQGLEPPPASSDKCNWLASMAYAMGAGIGWRGTGVPVYGIHAHPPSAEQFADPNAYILNFPVVLTGDGCPIIQGFVPGDIVAFQSAGDAHTTLYLGGGLLIYAGPDPVKINRFDFVGAGFSTWTVRRYNP